MNDPPRLETLNINRKLVSHLRALTLHEVNRVIQVTIKNNDDQQSAASSGNG